MSDEHISLNEAARRSGLHPNSLRRLLRDGEIQGYKIGWYWWVSTASLTQYTNPFNGFLLDMPGPKMFLSKRDEDDDQKHKP
jgi:hypothetical protein